MPLHRADRRLVLLRVARGGAEAGRPRFPRPVAAGNVPAHTQGHGSGTKIKPRKTKVYLRVAVNRTACSTAQYAAQSEAS